MKKVQIELDLVFAAACDSEDIAEIFKNSGAKHVVCTVRNR